MINGWITDAANLLKIDIEDLNAAESALFFQRLREHYADSDSELPVWETMRECTSRKRVEGWKDVAEFVGEKECYLLTEKDGQDAFRIKNGNDLYQLLAECPGFEFYITNATQDYLLCHNHHDYLIGAGRAMTWVAEKKDDAGQTL